jgi:hypothetical protein
MHSVVKKALKLYKKDSAAWSQVYKNAKEDLEFISGIDGAQWDSNEYLERTSTGRPCLTIDQLSQFIHQVENDIRMNTPSINVIPSDEKATEVVAEVYQGLIKDIEYKSQADDAYDMAASFAVRGGIGFLRVCHNYVDESEGFEQELKIKRVINPLSVLIDSDTVEAAASDIMHGFIFDEISLDTFKERYPKFDPVSFETTLLDQGDKPEPEEGEDIRIAEFYEIVETPIEYEEGDKKRTATSRKVMRYVLSGDDVLEESEFAGKYIPIVPVYGEETYINGKRDLKSLIRNSKDAQKMFNLWKSLETELLMKAPKAPVMAPKGSTEDFKEDWINPDKAMVLRYNTEVNGKPINPPQRLAPPPIPTGIVNASRATVDDIKSTMGLYNASIGVQSNETSGIAIQRRQQEGDVATYHFGDNLTKAITQVGRIIISAAREIYDTPRILKTVGMEEEIKDVGVNGARVEGQEEDINLKEGRFSVRVVTGAPFTTRRQEAAQFFSQIVQSQPQLMEVMGDLLFKYSDIAGAEAMASRMKKIISPELQDVGDGAQEIDPEKMKMAQAIKQGQMALQQMQGQMMELQKQLQDKSTEYQLKAKELLIKEQDVQVKAQDDVLDAQQSNRKLDIEEYKAQQDVLIKQQELEIERLKVLAGGVSNGDALLIEN